MTKFQDPPLQSRRAVRKNEVRPVDETEVDAPARPATARTGRRAQLPSATEWNAANGDATGNGEAKIVASPSEPFTFTTQTLPQRTPVSFEARTATSAAESQPAGAGAVSTSADKPRASTGRRVSLPAGEAHIAPAVDVEVAEAEHKPDVDAASIAVVETSETNIVVPTFAEPEAAPAEAAVKNSPVDETADDGPVVQRTMTRRELRELRAAAERAGELQVPEAISAILNSGPIILPYLSAAKASAAAATEREAAAGAEFDALTREPDADNAESSSSSAPAAPASTWGITLEPAAASRSAENEDGDDDLTTSIAGPPVSASSSNETTADASPVFVDPTHGPTSARAAGHWSVRADMDDDIESLENTITRSVGTGGALTSSALVLPAIPQSSDITSPFTASGEIMATGSVDLPRSLASTGVHPNRVDTSDFDLDPLDHEVPSTDSAPVRAIRAVSTHTGSNGMVTSNKQSNRTLTVLVISASTMAVGVVGLLIVGYALQIFP